MARSAIEARQAADHQWPARAARAQLWEALALSRMHRPAALREALAAAEKAGIERRTTQSARQELETKKGR